MDFFEEAKQLKSELIRHRCYIHQNAELGLDLPKTSAYVANKLRALGIQPQFVAGGCGIKAVIHGKEGGKTFLLRADMDALPILEENDLPFRCVTGAMHACGHDFHTAMLLGAAELLRAHQDELNGNVTLMFQPGEEKLIGAQMMIDEGLLENPRVDAALMLHMQIGRLTPQTGAIIVSAPKGQQKACDWFTIQVKGRGCHGAYPDIGIDPLNVLAHLFIAMQEINAREVAPGNATSITVGQMHGGSVSNAIPESAYMSGTIRTMDEKTRAFVKQRLQVMCAAAGEMFRAQVECTFESGCPVLDCDEALLDELCGYTVQLLGAGYVEDNRDKAEIKRGMGSEDFACVAAEVPAASFNLSGGNEAEGYIDPTHSPKAMFNEDALPYGAAVYANSAFMWLKHHG